MYERLFSIRFTLLVHTGNRLVGVLLLAALSMEKCRRVGILGVN